MTKKKVAIIVTLLAVVLGVGAIAESAAATPGNQWGAPALTDGSSWT